MAKTGDSSLKHLSFLNENDPINLLNTSNYLDQLVPIIKSNIQSNSINALVDTLNSEISKKDDELIGFIRTNEQNINKSTADISQISQNAAGINEQLLDINNHLFKTSRLTIDRKFQLLGLKKNISKINESVILINKILQILELTDKTQELIKDNKFFNALKNLNDLNSLNKEFDQDLKFLNKINDSIPVLKSVIRDESLSLLKRNLSSLDSKYEQVTSSYYDNFSFLIAKWNTMRNSHPDFKKYKVNSSVEISLRNTYIALDENIPQLDELLDYDFIHDSYLIFKTLDQLPYLKNEFNKELNLRRDKILYPFLPNDRKNENFGEFIKDQRNLKQFLFKLIGFLIFHKGTCIKIPQLSNKTTSDIWDNLSTKIYPFLKNFVMNEILETDKILELKPFFGNLYLILEHFKLGFDHFYNLLIILFKKFIQFSTFEFKKDFEKLAEEDDSMPMAVYDLKLYKKIVNISWYDDKKPLESLKFPQVLPFSSIYPMACAQIRNFISHQEQFLKDYFKYDVISLDELVVENIDNLFLTVINDHYDKKLGITTREELSQNLINLEYFLIMSKEISSDLSTKYNKPIALKSTEAFSNTRKHTETKLFEIVDGKIDDLMDFTDWDWQTTEFNQDPNYFIKDIGDFLKNMFSSTFSNLPYSVKSLLLYRVFDLLAIRFLENLNEARHLTPASISNFDLDVCYIESITKDLNPGQNGEQSAETSGRGSLQSMFLQLRQTINLLKSGDIEEYKDQTTRMRKYNQIKPDEAVGLLNKLHTEEPFRNASSPVPEASPSKITKLFRSVS